MAGYRATKYCRGIAPDTIENGMAGNEFAYAVILKTLKKLKNILIINKLKLFHVKHTSQNMKILLVRLSSMGDLIHTLPAIEDLARQCPDVELHWLCEAGFTDIARLHPFVKNPCDEMAAMAQTSSFRLNLRENGSSETDFAAGSI